MENKEIIYFGLTFDKFDTLDFKDDFLAGIRSNFFNSGFETQANRCVQYIDDIEYSFVYSMEKGKQLSWKVNKNGLVYQNSEKVSNDSYRINTYNENGKVFKRFYFDNNHIWLKSEYLSDGLNTPEYVLYPSEVDGKDVIVKLHNDFESTVKSYLYPKTSMPQDGDYSALAYTNIGFLFFNSVPNNKFISKTVIRDNSVNNLGGFEFDLVDFNLSRNLNSTFDITDVEYLNDENGKPYYEVSNKKYNKPDESIIEENDIKVYEKETDEPDTVIESLGESYKYFGELDENNKRSGFGRTVTPSGTTAYEGEYHDDMRNGFGTFYFKNHKVNYVGNWHNNRRDGFGIGFRGSDGSSHIGKWFNNSPEGLAARFDKDGNFIFLGNYVDGKKQGKGITVDDDGSFVVSVFENDEVISSYKIDDLLKNL
ncbi:MAG: hypothetical protein J1E41_05865 [Ruminococcus sp.]|nr:hypothetical protein [Ruminococcus sp.]